MIAIIVFTVFASIVAYGVFDLRNSKLSPETKSLVLTAIGILLSVSLLISSLKETRHLTFSLLKSDLNILERKFTHVPAFKYKHSLSQSQPLNQAFYLANYPLYNDINVNNNQRLIYVSRKNQGASVFLYHLTQRLQKKRVPALYLKLQSQVYDQSELLQQLDLPSLKTLQELIETWNIRKAHPYIIIDGLQHIANCRPFLARLKDMFGRLKVNFVGNTENKRALERLFQTIPYNNFIVRQWTAPERILLESVFPHSYFKSLPSDFSTLAQVQSSSEQQVLLRGSSRLKELASQIGVTQVTRQISGRGMRVSALKTKISPQQLENALELGVLKVKEGMVYVGTGF